MEITSTPEIAAFLKRCEHNLQDERINSFLDRIVTPGNEHYLQKQLAKAGAQEFCTEESQWPSLFLSTKEWLTTPYHRNIHLDHIASSHFSYERETVEKGYLFNAYEVQPDKDRELKDWMKLRAMDEDYEALYLYQDGMDWMVDAPSECFTNDPIAAKAHGKVLTFGLGIGYFLYMAMRSPKVESITVVEQSADVIAMFREFLLPQFPKNIPLELICGDAYAYFNPEFLDGFDYVYTDIWQSETDGLFAMSRLLNGVSAPADKFDFWIEDSCVVALRTLIWMKYEELVFHKKMPVSRDYEILRNKVSRCFDAMNTLVDSVEDLKFFLYDRKTLRGILSMKEEQGV